MYNGGQCGVATAACDAGMTDMNSWMTMAALPMTSMVSNIDVKFMFSPKLKNGKYFLKRDKLKKWPKNFDERPLRGGIFHGEKLKVLTLLTFFASYDG